jgi:hypothetical protein
VVWEGPAEEAGEEEEEGSSLETQLFAGRVLLHDRLVVTAVKSYRRPLFAV